jgi:hypothetical protein
MAVMTETSITFSADSLRLEGRLQWLPGDRGAVITHPHPLYGGSLHNPVVDILTRAFCQSGYTTLRFNFRGVDASEGQYDQGRGERRDVAAALTYLAERDKTALALAGYSFGAWVNARLAPSPTQVQKLIFVSPPVGFLDFSEVGALPQLRHVIVGDRDPYAPLSTLEHLLNRWNPTAELHVLRGADHFYFDAGARLEALLRRCLGRR